MSSTGGVWAARLQFPSPAYRAWRRCTIGLMAFVLLLVAFQSSGRTGGQTGSIVEIIKISLEPDERKTTWYTNEKPKLKLQLRDARNKEKNAPETFDIAIEARSLEGVLLQAKSVTIRQGTDSETFHLKEVRVVCDIKIKATHEKLLEGGTFISVIARPDARPRTRRRSAAVFPEGLEWGDSLSPSVIRPATWAPGSELRTIPAAFQREPNTVPDTASPRVGPTLTIVNSPERSILADGTDRAEICVFMSRSFETETRIELYNSGGRLERRVIEIPAHQLRGCASLTSDDTGDVRITYQGSTPDREFVPRGEVKIHFKAPITKFELKPAPMSIPLIDNARISITLFNGQAAAATSEERKFTLTVASGDGGGDIYPSEITIPEREFQKCATFIPKTRGSVIVSATTEGFPSATTELVITGIPTLLLILTLLGGFCGGMLAYWVRASQKWWRVVLGVVTGCVFYWALIFGVLPGLLHGIVLNEVSAFILPTLGGWLGTEVFTLVLKRIGVGESVQPESRANLPAG